MPKKLDAPPVTPISGWQMPLRRRLCAVDLKLDDAMTPLIECVPNFSEGCDGGKVDALLEAILSGPEVYYLNKTMDRDHNRSVITFAGTLQRVGEAALRGIGRAAELIDLNHHHGVHPRIGAADVIPFVPLAGSRMEDCICIAERVAEQTWQRYRIPAYLYGAAARSRGRRNLEVVRSGGFEGLREAVRSHAERHPDFGEPRLHPTAGAIAVGARKVLIAYNINLDTPEVAIAREIARTVRTATGGLPCVKALGLRLESRKLAQVSMNLTDFETTSVPLVFEVVRRKAEALGAGILESEIVGLVPRAALEGASIADLKIRNFSTELILENRLSRALENPRDA